MSMRSQSMQRARFVIFGWNFWRREYSMSRSRTYSRTSRIRSRSRTNCKQADRQRSEPHVASTADGIRRCAAGQQDVNSRISEAGRAMQKGGQLARSFRLHGQGGSSCEVATARVRQAGN